ncbi:MAG: hypothetical protein GX330_02025 [Bacteroidales bacterium]|nr:hypothetical protein [Bacteroidales bacterium]
MKNLKLAITVAILLFFSSCEKDRRNKYIGDWDFVTEKLTQTYSNSGWEIVESDTIYYLGKVSCGEYESCLIIQYTENDIIDVSIDKFGNIFTICPGGSCKCGNFEGENKVHFSLGWINPEKPEIIVGTKIKRR